MRKNSVLVLGIMGICGCFARQSAAQGAAQLLDMGVLGGSVDSNGVLVSPFDNPVITGHYQLGAGPDGSLLVASQQGDAWFYSGVGLWVQTSGCAASDPFCVPVGTRNNILAWPGDGPPGANSFPTGASFEAHGVMLGTSPSQVALFQEFSQSQTGGGSSVAVVPTPARSIRLVDGMLIVPINATVIVPKLNPSLSPDARPNQIMARARATMSAFR